MPPAPKAVDLGRLHAKIEQPARSDGYRPICEPLWVWGAIVGVPGQDAYRLFWSAARRLDTGHRQIERVRQALDNIPPIGSPAGRQSAHEIIGDAEMAVWAIDKALEIAVSLPGRFRIERTVPKALLEAQPLVSRLRDHYSHIEERALGLIKGKPDASAEDAFEITTLVRRRILTDGRDSLDIDDEATTLCIQTRDYLIGAWTALTARERASAAP